MPTTMTPTITTKRKKHSLFQQYIGMCSFTVNILKGSKESVFHSEILQNMGLTELILTFYGPQRKYILL
jgi:hypothetical protein